MDKFMIKKLLPIIFFLFLISCSSENENKTSEIELSGEKVKIMNPSTGIDTAGGLVSLLSRRNPRGN